MTRRDTTTLFDDYRIADADLERRGLTTQTLRHELQRDFITADEERVDSKNDSRDLGLVRRRAQDDGHRQLAATIDTREHAVLRVELEVEPRATVRNDACGEQQLARRMRLAAVVIEEHAW